VKRVPRTEQSSVLSPEQSSNTNPNHGSSSAKSIIICVIPATCFAS